MGKNKGIVLGWNNVVQWIPTVLVIFALGGCVSCLVYSEQNIPYEERIDNITSVFWHQGNSFTFMIETPGTKENRMYRKYFQTYERDGYANIYFKYDIQEGQKMWAYFKGNCARSTMDTPYISYGEIHLRSVDDLNGADRNLGKFGKSTTRRVQ